MRRGRLILVLGIVFAALLGLWLGPRFHRGIQADMLPDLLQLAPADSTTIVYADLTALRSTPWIEQLAAAAPAINMDADYAEFVQGTGFAFERDLDQVVLAVGPGARPQTLVFAEGRFDRQKITAYALRSGKQENRNGRTVYVLPSATSGKNISVTFLEGGRIALSDGGDFPPRMAAAPGAGVALDPGLRDRLSRVAGSPVFAVVKIPPPAAGSRAAQDASSPFQYLRWVSLAAKPDGGRLLLSAEGECSDADQARKLAAGLEFFRTILGASLTDPKARGRLSADGAGAASRLLQDVTISNSAERVRLLLSVTPAMLSTLTSLMPAPAKPASPATAPGKPGGRSSR